MKKLTPLQELITTTTYTDGENYFVGGFQYGHDLTDFIKELLEKEKQVIVDAYTAAQKEMLEVISANLPIPETTQVFQEILSGNDNEDAIEYYNNKYTK